MTMHRFSAVATPQNGNQNLPDGISVPVMDQALIIPPEDFWNPEMKGTLTNWGIAKIDIPYGTW